MADMPTSFWAGWITVITVVSMAGLVWLLFSIYFGSGNANEQEHVVWDETLNEGSHPAPLWWFWLIFSAMIFTVIYLILYPGLGSFSGALKWSQGHQIEESYMHYHEDFDAIRESVLTLSVAELQQDEFVMNSARGIFERNCAGCHGPEGGGMANRFPNLMDADWQWGGTAEQIEQTLRQGRKANMPAWGASLDDQKIAQVIAYIRALGSTTGVTTAEDPGKTIYNQFCVGCHGAEGKGNIMLGAPNLADAAWLYGNDDAALTETLRNGRNGVMPVFAGRLNDVQIRMLVAWLSR